MSCRHAVTLKELDSLLKPKTPAENERLLALWTWAQGQFDEQDLWDLQASNSWRSKTAKFRDREFCARCDQLLSIRICTECGMPLNHFSTRFDSLPDRGIK